MIATKTQPKRTFATRIDLAEEARGPVVAPLNQQLADTFDLYSQTKQAYWNVKGAQFYPLHALFDRLAGELAGYVDRSAGGAAAGGGLARGTAAPSAANS